MDATSLSNGTYTITNLTINQTNVVGEFPELVEISFEEEIVIGESYDVTISELKDCSGNEIAETTITFGFGRAPTFNEILITEIMADEVPSVGLPQREYIEIYNASDDILSTEGMELSDATGRVSLPMFNIEPQSYVVLTSNSGVSEFANAVALTSYFSNNLNNSGEPLALIHESNLIFSIAYDPAWHEESRADGGYALEMIDLTNPCVESGANWSSSTHPNGGTPGEVNAINNPESVPDNLGPNVLNISAIGDDSLRIIFDEKIDPESLSMISYTFSPDFNVLTSVVSPEFPEVVFTFSQEKLIENVPYTVSIAGVTDCNG
ncbi:MAG: lamin tail domain-containing protein, partial [Bacteroidota bacterium]